MDANGARYLAARIKAGVGVGTRVELVADGVDARLSAGDRGVVVGLDETGRVLVRWDGGAIVEFESAGAALRALS
jgi:hypothetical protein